MPLLFIGGLHRSGTTLLGRLLAANPEVSSLTDTGMVEDEGQFLQDCYPSDVVYGGAGRFGLDSRAHMTEASPLATAGTAERLLAAWSPYWQGDATWTLEKSPANLIRSRFLQALYPDARFIFITRHPVAVALAVRKWTRTSIYPLIHHWLHCHRLLREDLPSIRSYCLLSYEQLSAAPEETLQTLCRYLDLEPHALPIEVKSGINAAYFKQWADGYGGGAGGRDLTELFDPRLSARKSMKDRLAKAKDRRVYKLVERWLGPGRYNVSLARRDAEDAVAMFEEEINGFGYSLLDLDRRPDAAAAGERSAA
ncbi:MAG: sulfotransferase [Alphaproteobacteria bacterium]|nr:sulfotransferase [Alphaproteobacteria bacterium]